MVSRNAFQNAQHIEMSPESVPVCHEQENEASMGIGSCKMVKD